MRPLAQHFVVAGVASLVEIAPLIESGVIQTFFTGSSQSEAELYSSAMKNAVAEDSSNIDEGDVWQAFEAEFIEGLNPPLRKLWEHIRAGDKAPSLEYVRASAELDSTVTSVFVEIVKELNPAAIVSNAIDIVASTITDALLLGGKYDVYCPSPLFARLLFLGSVDALQELRVRQLASVEVPNIANLLIEDAVKIRSESDAFAVWRSRLSAGLDRARHLRSETGQHLDPVPIIEEVLVDARASLLREASTSHSMNRRLRGMIGFTVGTIGGALGGAQGGIAGMLLGAAGAGVPWLVQQAIDRSVTPGFLHRHYVLFNRQESSNMKPAN